MLNIGTNPTFQDRELSLEVHILDFHEEVYGESLKIEFIDKIRDEEVFPDANSLVVQIHKDIEKTKMLLGRMP